MARKGESTYTFLHFWSGQANIFKYLKLLSRNRCFSRLEGRFCYQNSPCKNFLAPSVHSHLHFLPHLHFGDALYFFKFFLSRPLSEIWGQALLLIFLPHRPMVPRLVGDFLLPNHLTRILHENALASATSGSQERTWVSERTTMKWNNFLTFRIRRRRTAASCRELQLLAATTKLGTRLRD